MTALATFRDTKQMGCNPLPVELCVPMKAATTIYAGSIVVSDAGYAAPGRTATGLITLGMAMETVVNSGAAGAKKVRVKPGVFKWGNSSAGDLIAQANCYADVYIADDQTVALTSATNTRSIAGKVIQVDSDGVWVQTVLGT